MIKLNKRAQSTAEYAIVIALVIAAAVAMQVYVKRGLQAKVKGTVDFNPDPTVFKGKQYEPYYSESNMDTTREAREMTKTEQSGKVTRSLEDPEVISSWGTQTTVALPE